MKAPVGGGADFAPAPSGSHPAILTQLIDLGTQEGSYEGKISHKRKIRMVFELHSDEARLEDGKPMVVGREFTLSSHENATLRQFIEGWRGKSFTDEEAAEFDYQVMLGKPCILNIKHDKAQNGKVYANIDSAIKLMKGMEPPVQINPTVYFYMGTAEDEFHDFDELIYVAFPQWVKEKIAKSPEYQQATGGVVTAVAKAKEAVESPFDDQEIPF